MTANEAVTNVDNTQVTLTIRAKHMKQTVLETKWTMPTKDNEACF